MEVYAKKGHKSPLLPQVRRFSTGYIGFFPKHRPIQVGPGIAHHTKFSTVLGIAGDTVIFFKTTSRWLYKKNGYIIDVNFEYKNPLEWKDLFNHIQKNPPGNSDNIGHSSVDKQSGISSNAAGVAFIQFKHWQNQQYLSNEQLNYTLGYAISHEFLHQILEKCYHSIFNNLNGMVSSFDGQAHILLDKNLLFPGDGLSSRKDYLLPQDRNFNDYVTMLFFTGRYLPKKNNPSITSEWERISPSHKKLINSHWTLYRVKEFSGHSSPTFKFWNIIFSKELKDYDYSIP